MNFGKYIDMKMAELRLFATQAGLKNSPLHTPRELEQIKRSNLETYRENHGIKRWLFDDGLTEIWATNYRNALRKYNNLKNK